MNQPYSKWPGYFCRFTSFPCPVIQCTSFSKLGKTVARISRMSQFHESFNLNLGCFFRPSKWRRGTTESRFQQHSVFRGQHREWAPGAGYRHQPWGWRPWQKETCPRIIHGGRFNVWIHDQWWQKLNDIWTDWFVNKAKNSSKKQCYMNIYGNLTSFFYIYWRKCRLKFECLDP